MTEKQNNYAMQLIKYAYELGAVDAKKFEIDELVFDCRTLLKCMFGCKEWGFGLTCPSANPHVTMEQYEKMIRKYKYGIIIHANNKKPSHDISFKLEKKAFLDGYYFAFSMSDCAQCKICAGFSREQCRNKSKARPAFHSLGIDLYATVKKFDLPLYPLKENDQRTENWYSAILVE